ncbi:hypothetical protein NESM_000009000 [Novymonas esmeraldas]|uniref:Uncharacterized protein n=1 Tax=Novymonas esmeraldas TaxID=1808958 RepID=A0AAW0F226_9TRYP
MQSTYPGQNCGCDFCGTRRSVNAKKSAVSKAAAQRSTVKQRSGCECDCHDDGQTGGSSFDPGYPEPVNQTALNAARGRNGVPGGNQYTIRNGTTRATGRTASHSGAGDHSGSAGETAEQRQAREMAELDALERLLMLEYKARTKAAMEAERLKGNATSATGRRPQPLPEGYTSNSAADMSGYPEAGTWGRSGDGAGAVTDARTIHEAYAMAHGCPAEPPTQCHASHRLQDTLDDVRKVTADPVNTVNRRALQQLLHQHGMAETPKSDYDATATAGNAVSGAGQSAFGSTLAQIRTSYAHPRGAGVVWAPRTQSPAKSQTYLAESSAPAADGTAASKRPPVLSPGAAAAVAAQEKHVTYAA